LHHRGGNKQTTIQHGGIQLGAKKLRRKAVSWIKDRLEEKQVVLEQEWLRDRNATERHPARTLEEVWEHVVAAIDRDVQEFNALRLCGDQQAKLSCGPLHLQLMWSKDHSAVLSVHMDAAQERITYTSGGPGSKPRTGDLKIRLRRGSNAVLYNGRPSPLTYEEASQYLLQPVLMP
jgi:hypothetical protein